MSPENSVSTENDACKLRCAGNCMEDNCQRQPLLEKAKTKQQPPPNLKNMRVVHLRKLNRMTTAKNVQSSMATLLCKRQGHTCTLDSNIG